jgi:hypothetical protein
MTPTTTQTGLVGFTCEVTNQAVSFQECLACAQKGAAGCPMVPAAVHVAMNSIRDPQYAQKLAEQAGAEIGFSVTELLSCARQLRLKQENPYYEKPSSLYRMNRGTGYHGLLSEYPEGIREETLSWRFKFQGKSILLVGTPDLIELIPAGWLITDYKVTGHAPGGRKIMLCGKCEGETYTGEDGLTCRDCGSIFRSKSELRQVYRPPQPRSSHVMQVNLYALLIEKNADALASKLNAAKPGQFAGAQVVYFPDKAPVRCVATLDREATMAFLKSVLAALLSPDLPHLIDDADELWRCDYCPVRSLCEEIHGAPVGKAALD